MSFINKDDISHRRRHVSVPLRGMGFIKDFPHPFSGSVYGFRPLTGHGFHPREKFAVKTKIQLSVPLRGMGFIHFEDDGVSSGVGFRPLTGHGFHRQQTGPLLTVDMFPSPYGAWVSSPGEW